MRNRGNAWAAVLVTALALALVASAASANRSIVLNPLEGELGRVEARSTSLTFTDEEVSFRVVCEVTRTLRLNRTIAKVEGAEMGSVTGVEVRNCTGGSAKALIEAAPWRISYVSFSGTLPGITEVRFEIRQFAFLFQNFQGMAQCLYIGNVQETTRGNPINSLVFDETVLLPLGKNLGLVECPARIIIAGSLTLRPNVQMRLL